MHYTNILSWCFEKFAHFEFPPKIQRWIHYVYIKIFQVNLEEFDTLASYPTLNALFTRSLVKMRQFDKTPFHLIAPCDSIVMEFGQCQENYAMQVKGRNYHIDDFVKTKLGEDYCFVNFYLSPSDYHRFHAPLNLKVKHLEFIDGRLHSVCEKSLLRHKDVFVQNRRVVLECEDEFGEPFYFVAIGALNVGKIQINFAPEVAQFKTSQTLEFKTPVMLKKGEEIGSFLMGSTIVLLSKNWQYDLRVKERVYFGQCIAKHKTKNIQKNQRNGNEAND